MDHVVAFCSPHGTTRHVAGVIARRLAERGAASERLDLGARDAVDRARERIARPDAHACLWVGSPVYAGRPVPPVTQFVESLPRAGARFAVPYVTYGAVSSGIALSDLGGLLRDRGIALLGAARVVALHSCMWHTADPLGAGHPDAQDDDSIAGLVDAVLERLAAGGPALPPERLDYQPEELAEVLRARTFSQVRSHFPPIAPDETRCSLCGECVERCPAGAVTLDPLPRRNEDCFLCLACVRHCPQDAIPLDLEPLVAMIRRRAAELAEQPATEVYL